MKNKQRGTTKARIRKTARPSQIARTQERMKNEGGKTLPAPTPIPATKRKSILDISTHDYLSFHGRFYKTLTGSDPDWDHDPNGDPDDPCPYYGDPDDWPFNYSDPEIGDTYWNHEIDSLRESRISAQETYDEHEQFARMADRLPTIIQRWIELHPIGYEERAKNLADLDKLRPEDKTLLKDNFPDFAKWHKELYRLTGLDWELNCQIKRFKLTADKYDRPWTIEKRARRQLKILLESRLKEIKQRLKSEIWPTETKWIKELKWLQIICNRHTFLLPILRELNKARLHEDQCRTIHEKYNIPYLKAKDKKGKKLQRPLLFIRTDYEKLAGRAGCSEISLKNYLRALIETGLIQQHRKRGPKPWTFYSIGYYYRTPKGQVAARFLKQETKNKLKGFNPNN